MNETLTSDIRKILKQHSAAERKVRALVEFEELVMSGIKTRAAIEDVAFRSGLSGRSLFTYLQKTKGIPRDAWEAALAPKRRAPRPKVICHPDALKRFIDLCRGGAIISASFRQVKAEAGAKGWSPIPSERTLRRELDRQVSWSERFSARRATKPDGEE